MWIVASMAVAGLVGAWAYVAPPAYARDLCYPPSRSGDCLYVVTRFAEFAEQIGIDMWIDFGTLLGSVRHGSPIPWDWDGDVSVLQDDTERLRALLPTFFAAHGVYYSGAYPDETIKLYYGSCVVDVEPWEIDEVTNILHPVPEEWSNRKYAFPASYVQNGLSLCPLGDAMVPCPQRAKELISSPARYGSSWWLSIPYKLDCYWPIGPWLRWLIVKAEGGDVSKSFSYLSYDVLARLERESNDRKDGREFRPPRSHSSKSKTLRKSFNTNDVGFA